MQRSFFLTVLFLLGCSPTVAVDEATAPESENGAGTQASLPQNAGSPAEARSATTGSKKAILFTSQQRTTLNVYFATYDEFQTLPAWEPPHGPDIDLKQLAATASGVAHRQVTDAENWKLSECSISNADIGKGASNFQYATFKFICKSARHGWTSTTVYMNLSGSVLEPETHEFPDRDSLNEFEEQLRERYSNWAE